MVNGVALAGGYFDRQQDTLHGKKVPNTHVCVMLTTAKPNIKAPFIAGDIEENSFLEKGNILPSQRHQLSVQSYEKIK